MQGIGAAVVVALLIAVSVPNSECQNAAAPPAQSEQVQQILNQVSGKAKEVLGRVTSMLQSMSSNALDSSEKMVEDLGNSTQTYLNVVAKRVLALATANGVASIGQQAHDHLVALGNSATENLSALAPLIRKIAESFIKSRALPH